MIKSELFSFCLNYVDERIRNTNEAIREAQESSNAESKSTAGDKHDTSRSMMQIEVERLSKQMAEAQEMKATLSKINMGDEKSSIVPGALVLTSRGNYFIAVAAGKITIEGAVYFAISASSPIGALLKGKKKGDSFAINNGTVQISEVA